MAHINTPAVAIALPEGKMRIFSILFKVLIFSIIDITIKYKWMDPPSKGGKSPQLLFTFYIYLINLSFRFWNQTMTKWT